jgi:hypothetical protein
MTELETATVYPLTCVRLVQSVLMSAHSRALEPDNEYLGVTEGPAWRMLEFLFTIPFDQARLRVVESCGYSKAELPITCKHSRLVANLASEIMALQTQNTQLQARCEQKHAQ